MRSLVFVLALFVVALVLWLGFERASVLQQAGAKAEASRVGHPARTELDTQAETEDRAPAAEGVASTAVEEELEWPAHVPRSGGIVLELVDANGAPRAGVKLAVELELWRLLGHEHPDKYQHQDVVTDAAGRAPIAATRADEIENVELHREGAKDVTATGPFELAPGTTDVVRLLYPTRIVLKGRTLDFAGRALEPRARIELEPHGVAPTTEGLNVFMDEQTELRAEEDGSYAFEIVPGWYTLGAATPGEPVFELLTLRVEPEPSELVVDLRIPTHDRRVRLRLASSKRFDPIDMHVAAQGAGRWPALANPPAVVARRHEQLRFTAPSEADGTWLLELAPGPEYEVRAGGPGFAEARAPLPPDAETITLTLVPEAEPQPIVLRGRATDVSGSPLSGEVSLLRSNDLEAFDHARTDSEGAFEFRRTRFEPEQRTAFVFGRFGAAGTAGIGPIALDHSRSDLDLVVSAPLEIEGRIENLADEKGAEVRLLFSRAHFTRGEAPLESVLFGQSLRTERFRTESDGGFQFDGLPPGEYVLWAEPVQRRQPPARRLVRAGDRDVRVRLGEGLDGDVVFECRVVDAVTRLPIGNAEVGVRGPDSQSIARGARGRTGTDGRCELLGHSPGRWFVDARARDHAWLTERFVEYGSGRHSVEIALSPSCELDVELVDASGAPLADLEVCAVASDGAVHELLDFYGNSDGSILSTNIAGRVRLTGLPVGPVRIAVGWSRGAPKELPLGDGRVPAESSLELTLFDAVLTLEKRARVRQVLR
ncbi:MAG: hypothetical protein HZA53_12035 [Planctomycetes bacterium]|nr:hypothetical protein [Planctomycetota bacterium]